MKTLSMLLLAPALLAFASHDAHAQEVSIKPAQLPAEIRAAVAKRFPNAPMTTASREVEDGKTSYEVTVKVDGKKVDVTASTAGELTLIEREMAKKDLPAAVAALIDAKYPKARYHTVEDVSTVSSAGESLSYYEVLLTDSSKQKWELQVALDGSRIITTEKKKPGDVD
ncbi:MAG TPA: PepSY-like domain-containing protein [Gemmatimonadaceae bacterium]